MIFVKSNFQRLMEILKTDHYGVRNGLRGFVAWLEMFSSVCDRLQEAEKTFSRQVLEVEQLLARHQVRIKYEETDEVLRCDIVTLSRLILLNFNEIEASIAAMYDGLYLRADKFNPDKFGDNSTYSLSCEDMLQDHFESIKVMMSFVFDDYYTAAFSKFEIGILENFALFDQLPFDLNRSF